MTSHVRSGFLNALRTATQFDVPLDVLHACLHAESTLLDDPTRIKAAEVFIENALLDEKAIPASARARVLPVLGNIAEAVIESVLEDHGWQPVGDDDAGFASGHGVDLLMLDSSLERLIAIEVKSTTQSSRWPRLASGRREQLTTKWLDAPGNELMVEWGLDSRDVYAMVVQLHFRRRRWRACLAGEPHDAVPLTDLDQLAWTGLQLDPDERPASAAIEIINSRSTRRPP